MIRQWSARLMLLLVLGSGLLSAQAPPAADRPSPLTRRILILNEVDLSSVSISRIDDAIRNSFQGSKYLIDFYSEHMNTPLFPGEADQKLIRDFYVRLYRDHRPDVIITVGSAPLQFMAEEHSQYFAGIPVVYCFPNGAESDLKPDPDFTGVTIGIDAVATLRAALGMLPHTQHVFVVTGTGPYDLTQIKEVQRQLKDFSSRVDITYLTNLAMPEIQKRVSNLPKDSIVLFASLIRDGAGNYYNSQQSGPMISSAANAPVFSLLDIQIGYGQVGGDLVNVRAQGEIAASEALKILDGVRPSDIPVAMAPNGFVFDWRALQRWGLTQSDLPPGSTILNRPRTTWEMYKWYILGGLSLMALEALLIFGLLLHRARAQKAEAELAQNQIRLAGLIETALDAIIAVDEGQRIVLFNAAAERIFGCPAASAIGSSLDRFVPQRFREAHRAHIRRFGETGKTSRVMGVLDTLAGVRSTGEEFPMDASISQVETSGKKLYTVIIRDITERKRAAEELQREKAFTEAVIDSLPDIYFVIQTTGAFLHWGRNPEKILGYSSEETEAMSQAVEIVAEEDRPLAVHAIEEGFASGSVTVEVQLLHKDGRKIPYLLRATRALIGSEPLLVGIGLDITERKQAEAESYRLNRALQTIVECRQRMAQAQDERAMLTDVCQVLVNLGGYRMAWVGFAENDAAKSVRPLVYAGHEEGYLETANISWADGEKGQGPTGTAIRTGQPSVDWDIASDPRMAPWRDEALRRGFVSSISLPLLQDGRAFGALTLYSSRRETFDYNELQLLTDLTNDVAYGIQALRTRADREQAVEALRESEAQLREAQHIAGIGSLVWDVDTDTSTWSPEFYRMMGLDSSQPPPKLADQSRLCTPESWTRLNATIQQALADRKLYDLEIEFVRGDGAVRWGHVRGTPVCDETGRVIRLSATLQDITERKLAAQALQESEARFRTLIEDAPIGIGMSRNAISLYANKAYLKMFGLQSLNDVLGQPIGQQWSPEFRAEVEERSRRRSRGEDAIKSFNGVGLRQDGTAIHVHAEVTTIKFADGLASIGFLTDVTEQKRAQERIAESEARFRTLIEEAPLGVRISRDGVGLYVNKAFLQMFGFQTAADLIGQPIINQWASESQAEAEKNARGQSQGEAIPKSLEGVGLRQDGTAIRVHADSTIVSLADGLANIAFFTDVTDQRRAEEALHRLRQAVDASGEVVVMTDLEGLITFINPQFTRTYGYAQEEVIGKTIRQVLMSEDISDSEDEDLRKDILTKQFLRYEIVNKTKDGRKLVMDCSANTVLDDRGEVVGTISIQRDITEKKRLEQRLMQSQKMEAVGQLAGGVAHDFNNILGIIIGYTELTLEDPTLPERPRKRLAEIKNAANRAIGVTRQLLTFSRKQVLETKVLDLNTVVQETTRMFGRLLGEDIEVAVLSSPNLWTVRADPTGIDQIILNLAVNARDAMPNGGKLTIGTANVTIDNDSSTRHGTLTDGDYVVLTVSDTGVGMDAEAQEHIFEPFFTTKEKGRGTGLGLSTVLGIVEQSGGRIWAYSEVGRGTTFKIYIPRAVPAGPSVTSEIAETIHGAGETILLAEDDSGLRRLNVELLRDLGYNVIEAVDGTEALGIVEQYPDRLHLLLTDVIMPGMNGQQLAEEALRRRPTLKVLFVSGHTSGAVRDKITASGAPFLQKPLSRKVLAKTLREILDSRETGAGKMADARNDA